MATRVYGASDDLIEFEGDLRGEVSCFGAGDDDDGGVLLAFSDGTILNVKFGKNGASIWALFALRAGDMFEHIEYCNDEDAAVYSDIAHFKSGKLKCWSATNTQRVT